MTTALVLGLMLLAAASPFVLLVRPVRQGRFGLALTVLSLLGACLTIAVFAAGRPFGVNPVWAMGVALIGFLPMLLGAGAGTLLGWMLRHRDERTE